MMSIEKGERGVSQSDKGVTLKRGQTVGIKLTGRRGGGGGGSKWQNFG